MGVTKYESGNQTFWKVDTRVHLLDGREKRVIKRKIPTRELALTFEAKLRTEAFEGRFFEKPASLTVKEAWERYKDVTKRENKSWQADFGRAVYVVKYLGMVNAAQLTQRHIDAYREKRFGEPNRRGCTPSVSTINHEVALLKRFLNRSVRRGELRSNPISQVRLLKENNVRQVVVSEIQFQVMHEAADDWFKPILLLAFTTGMRRQEVLGLRWDQLDLKEGIIRLAQSDTKSGKPRAVVLSERVKKMLSEIPRPINGGFVFTNPKTGKAYYDIKKPFRRAFKAAGMEGVWFHDLRRSFVTNARRRGIPESTIMRMTGHRSRNVFERYNVVSSEDIRAAVQRIEIERLKELAEATVEAKKKH